jgi:hypothetical protein
MKETCSKKKYRITTNTTYSSDDVGLFAAYNAIHRYNNDESLLITDNNTGEVLFEYGGGSVKWMDGDFARALLARFGE